MKYFHIFFFFLLLSTNGIFEQIRKLDAGIKKDLKFAGAKVPTFEETLDLMPENIWLNIHLKGNETAEVAVRVARIIVEKRRTHQAFVACDRTGADAIREVYPQVMICNMDRQGGDVSKYVQATIEQKCQFIQLLQLCSPEEMQQLKAAGVKVNFCCVQSAEQCRSLIEAGVDFPLVDDLGNRIAIERNDLGMILEKTDDKKKGKGIRLLSLIDRYTNTVLSANKSLPLFSVELLDKTTGETVSIHSEDGWKTVEVDRKAEQFVFSGANLPEGEKLCVVLKILAGQSGTGHGLQPGVEHGLDWHWQVRQGVDRYEFRKLNCPQISLRNLGTTMKAFYPYASGVVREDPCGKKVHWQAMYPNGWSCSMQWTAIYDETENTGFYVAMHDPVGSVKEIQLDAASDENSVTIRFIHPLPLDEKKNDAELSGVAAWRIFHGDWYDAMLIYRQWMQKNAQWYPRQKLGLNGRTDTPQWMKELCVWALGSYLGDSLQTALQKTPEKMKKFTDALGIPTGLHLYNWHQIPFDNDYPHYFPVKDGFGEAVAEIQKNGDCYVMPYINGRLWDIRDKGMEDYQFTSIALPAATKKEDGKPYTETYGSKETDGSAVELAVMCPATDVWKNKVSDIVLRLTNDYGVAGVYVDQIAAATPQLCFDKSHGHPLAGGSWWNSEYWKMIETIRSGLPEGKMLTTECNAEPFVHVFDGYLAWHFQYQDQVPAFAAVYGNAVQLFGRSYGDDVLAGRMKMAQQLVYGEQIGWINPEIVDDSQRFPFFKEIVLTRYKYRDYFYKGEMLRPPKLLDKIPAVSADWQWFTTPGQIITTDAVLTGAWRKTDGKGNTVSAVFFFVNISDVPITSRVAIRLDEIGLSTHATTFEKPLTFEPGVPVAIELAEILH